jgi:hypothetical protein
MKGGGRATGGGDGEAGFILFILRTRVTGSTTTRLPATTAPQHMQSLPQRDEAIEVKTTIRS